MTFALFCGFAVDSVDSVNPLWMPCMGNDGHAMWDGIDAIDSESAKRIYRYVRSSQARE